MYQMTLLCLLPLLCLQKVQAAKQHVMLSDSYLPVAMQVIAHLTDQMNYEAKDDPVKTTSKPPAPSKPVKPVSAPVKPVSAPVKPVSAPVKPVSAPVKPVSAPVKPGSPWTTTFRPTYVVNNVFEGSFMPLKDSGWWMLYSTVRLDETTPYHKPGLYAPLVPPAHRKDQVFLLPVDQNTPYTVLGPVEEKTEDKLLNIEQQEIKPIVHLKPETEPLLPPKFDNEKLSRTSEDVFLIDGEELTDENLQYLSADLRDMIKLAHDDGDDRLIDLELDVRGGDDKLVYPKGKLSASNLRLTLLYDLLSREAKKQRLSDYGGFSQSVMRDLIESASGGARAQLSLALSKMVNRHDCQHEYANNRAREMITELAKTDSTLSNELRYLQPLVYSL